MTDSFNVSYDPERQAWVPVEDEKQVPAIRPIKATDLMSMNLPEIEWLWEGVLPKGQVCLLSASPKSGKSFLGLGLSLAICQGKEYLKRKTTRGAVLYADLESGNRRPRDRIRDMMQGQAVPENLYLLTQDSEPKLKMLGDGFREQMEGFLQSVPDIALIVIDIYKKILPPEITKQDAYERSYEQMGVFFDLARKYGASFVLIHHNRKTGKGDADGDFTEKIYGSVGLSAAADVIIGLARKRKSADALLQIVGKDVEPVDLSITFNDKTCAWDYQGTAAEVEERIRVQEFRDSNVTKTVVALVDDDPRREVNKTAEEIKKASAIFKGGAHYIHQDARFIGRFLTANADLFHQEYCLDVNYDRNDSRRGYTIKDSMPFNQ